MKYLGIGIIIIAVVAVGIILYVKSKKKNVGSPDDISNVNTPSVKKKEELDAIHQPDELTIQVEMLPAEAIKDESKLVEITDSKVLAHVNNLIPGLAQAGNAVNNAAQAVNVANGEVLYRAIIPAGAKLTDSKAMEGAVRGFYRGADGIQGHANLVAVEAQKGTAAVANTAAAAMGVASMVVGQYYMTQINGQLDNINKGISQITDFQDNEYRSRVFSLVAHVKRIADFQVEILENNELRLSKISQLDSLEEECTQLLGQANLTLGKYAEKKDLDYASYEEKLKEAQSWFMYQQTLLDVLYKISDLRYALHLGSVSRQQCSSLIPVYTKQVGDAQSLISTWHKNTIERLGINTEKSKRKRSGFDGFIHAFPGFFNDEFNFCEINKTTTKMITEQASGRIKQNTDASELYDKDVRLISKDGKIYYLPDNEE